MGTKLKKILKYMFPNLTGYYTLIKEKKEKEPITQKALSLNSEDYPAYLIEFYKKGTKHTLNLDHPERFTEKVQWRKLFDRDPIYSLLSDKYTVRDWVEKKIGKEYLIPLLGHWKHFKDIEFELLPDQFVLKTNNGCHSNIIVRDKKQFLRAKWSAERKIEYWLKPVDLLKGLEFHYFNIEPLIIAEKYLQPQMNMVDLIDYKFHCFNGTPLMCEVIEGRSVFETVDYYDMNWVHLELENPPHPNKGNYGEKPKHYDEMVKIAKKLSQGFQYVRVDLFDNGRVYFGEMTFTPASGLDKYNPDEWDYKMGKLWDIHGEQINRDIVGL